MSLIQIWIEWYMDAFWLAFKSGFNLPAKVLAYTNDLEKEEGMTPRYNYDYIHTHTELHHSFTTSQAGRVKPCLLVGKDLGG